MGRRSDDDQDKDGRGRKAKREQEEEEVAEEAGPEEARVRQSAGNAFAAEGGQSAGLDAFHAEAEVHLKGIPDEGDPEAAGGPPPADEPYDAAWFGDAGWLPQGAPVAPVVDVAAWLPDRSADRKTRARRQQAMIARRMALEPAEDLWPTPPAILALDHPTAWARSASRWLQPSPLGQVLAWWLDTNTATLTRERAPRPVLQVRCAALAALSLAAVPHGPALDEAAQIRIALDTAASRIDRLEHRLASSKPALHTTAALATDALAHPELDEAWDVPEHADPAVVAWWADKLALRPGGTWRDPGAPVHAAGPRGLLQLPEGEAQRLRREQLAQLGVGAFRELLRQRVRAAGAIEALAAGLGPRLPFETRPSLRAFAERIDARSTEALQRLQRMGRGLQRPPYLPDAEARALLDEVLGHVDALRGAIAWEMAAWTTWALADDPLPEPARMGPQKGLVYAALKAGRLHHAREACRPRDAGDLHGRVAAALVPPLDLDALVPLHDAARAAGEEALAAAIATLGTVPLAEDGRAEAAAYFAEIGMAVAIAHANPPLLAEVAMRRALLALGPSGRREVGLGPLSSLVRPPVGPDGSSAFGVASRGSSVGAGPDAPGTAGLARAEEEIIDVGALLVGSGERAWAERLIVWAIDDPGNRFA